MLKSIKDRIAKRQIAYVYLLHRMFDGKASTMLTIMKIPEVAKEDILKWDREHKEYVDKMLEEDRAKNVAPLLDSVGDVPSIKKIKEKVLRRCDTLIQETTDPSKLATVYKILSEFEAQDDKREKTVLDAINESIKPIATKKEKFSMLDMLKKQQEEMENGKKDEEVDEEEEEELEED